MYFLLDLLQLTAAYPLQNAVDLRSEVLLDLLDLLAIPSHRFGDAVSLLLLGHCENYPTTFTKSKVGGGVDAFKCKRGGWRGVRVGPCQPSSRWMTWCLLLSCP